MKKIFEFDEDERNRDFISYKNGSYGCIWVLVLPHKYAV